MWLTDSASRDSSPEPFSHKMISVIPLNSVVWLDVLWKSSHASPSADTSPNVLTIAPSRSSCILPRQQSIPSAVVRFGRVKQDCDVRMLKLSSLADERKGKANELGSFLTSVARPSEIKYRKIVCCAWPSVRHDGQTDGFSDGSLESTISKPRKGVEGTGFQYVLTK